MFHLIRFVIPGFHNKTQLRIPCCLDVYQVDCPLYLVKLSGPNSAGVLAERKRQTGQVLYGEVTAAALATHFRNDTWHQGAAHVASPPLRSDPDTPATLLNMLARFLPVILQRACLIHFLFDFPFIRPVD